MIFLMCVIVVCAIRFGNELNDRDGSPWKAAGDFFLLCYAIGTLFYNYNK